MDFLQIFPTALQTHKAIFLDNTDYESTTALVSASCLLPGNIYPEAIRVKKAKGLQNCSRRGIRIYTNSRPKKMSQSKDEIWMLRELLKGRPPDPVAACNLMVILALRQGRFEAKILNHQTLEITLGNEVGQVWTIPSIVGGFRSCLGRLGNVFDQVSKLCNGVSNLRPVGRLSALPDTEFHPSAGWKIAGASFLDTPGSPFYNLRGELTLIDAHATQNILTVEMENTGISQRCIISEKKA